MSPQNDRNDRFPRLVESTSSKRVNTPTASFAGGSSDGGNDGGGMEARVARLESDVEYIKRDIGEIKTDVREIRNDLKVDFRLLFGALIGSVLGLAAIMAKGFGWLQ